MFIKGKVNEPAELRLFKSTVDAKKNGFDCKKKFFIGDFFNHIEITELLGDSNGLNVEDCFVLVDNPDKEKVRIYCDANVFVSDTGSSLDRQYSRHFSIKKN